MSAVGLFDMCKPLHRNKGKHCMMEQDLSELRDEGCRVTKKEELYAVKICSLIN